MRISFLLIILSISLLVSCKKDSFVINSVQVHHGDDYKLHDIKKINSTYVACGGSRFFYSKILKSEDGGNTWIEMPQALDKSMFEIDLVNDSLYYGACLDGKILKSTDAGLTWNIYQSYWRHVYALDHLGNDTIIACGAISTDKGIIFRSYDGLSSIQYDTTFNHDMRCVWIIDNQVVMMGGYGIFLRSTNAGLNWQVIDDLKNTFLTTIYFTDDKVGYTAGYEGNIFKTENGGLNWEKILDGNFFLKKRIHINHIDFYDKNHGVAACNEGYLLYTEDAGKSWRNLQAFDHKDINGILLNSFNQGIAVTDNGGIYLFDIIL